MIKFLIKNKKAVYSGNGGPSHVHLCLHLPVHRKHFLQQPLDFLDFLDLLDLQVGSSRASGSDKPGQAPMQQALVLLHPLLGCYPF